MRKTGGQDGFTLIEVLVSLMIFSIAILGLIQAGSENIKIIKALEKKQIAEIIADNQLMLAIFDKPVNAGFVSDEVQAYGYNWSWNLTTSKTEIAGFYQLKIQITQAGSDQILVQRIAFARQKPSQTARVLP